MKYQISMKYKKKCVDQLRGNKVGLHGLNVKAKMDNYVINLRICVHPSDDYNQSMYKTMCQRKNNVLKKCLIY